MSNRRHYRLLILLISLLPLTLAAFPAHAHFSAPKARVNADVQRWLTTANATDTLSVLVTVRDDGTQLQADQGLTIRSKAERRDYVHTTLRGRAERTTQTLRSFFANQRLGTPDFHSYMSFNGFAIKANKQVIEALRKADFVTAIDPDRTVYLHKPLPGTAEPRINAVEWNISKIGADRTWNELGINGTGVLVGGMDTGVRHTHETLRNTYKCAGSTSHSACWLDALSNRTTPYDDHNHGTHTMATAVGGNGVGVAPGAKWIACKVFNSSGSGSDAAILKCFDWFLAPGGSASNAPDVVINSWGDDNGSSTYFQQAVRNWVNAGIFPEFSNGNAGPSCNTVGSPASYAESFGVGSTTSTDAISSFSSRGPSPISGAGVKPNVSAPGSNIRSASGTSSDTGYTTMSGTSMAGPHVAGLVALLLDANPNLTIDQLKQNIQSNALGISSTACSSSGIPNNTFGYGRIDAYKSVQAALGSTTPTPVTVTPTPVTVTPTPVTRTPTPVTLTPTPVTRTPTPITLTPTPGGNILFRDDFESERGWTRNPNGSDTATLGQWERGDPEATDYSGAKQLGTTVSGVSDLVTGRLAGSSAGAYDLDGGVSSMQSPEIVLPSGSNPRLSFSYYLAHASNSGSDDYLRVSVVAGIPDRRTVVFEKKGAAANANAAWQSASADLNTFAGQSVRILVEAADVGTASLLEAAIDDLIITGSSSSTPTPVTPTPGGDVFRDDFETNKGWSVNPNGSDTATLGQWERGDPEATDYSGVKQLGTTVSGVNDLVTGRLAGSSAGAYDLDGGLTSVRSPAIILPAGNLSLSFSYYLAHASNSSSDDYLRISIIEEMPTGSRTVVFERKGAAANANAAWQTATVDVSTFAGQTIYLLIEAADAGGASLLEAAIDDVVVSGSIIPDRR